MSCLHNTRCRLCKRCVSQYASYSYGGNVRLLLLRTFRSCQLGNKYSGHCLVGSGVDIRAVLSWVSCLFHPLSVYPMQCLWIPVRQHPLIWYLNSSFLNAITWQGISATLYHSARSFALGIHKLSYCLFYGNTSKKEYVYQEGSPRHWNCSMPSYGWPSYDCHKQHGIACITSEISS